MGLIGGILIYNWYYRSWAELTGITNNLEGCTQWNLCQGNEQVANCLSTMNSANTNTFSVDEN